MSVATFENSINSLSETRQELRERIQFNPRYLRAAGVLSIALLGLGMCDDPPAPLEGAERGRIEREVNEARYGYPPTNNPNIFGEPFRDGTALPLGAGAVQLLNHNPSDENHIPTLPDPKPLDAPTPNN